MSGFISQLTAFSTGDNLVSVSTDVYVFLCHIMPCPYGSVHLLIDYSVCDVCHQYITGKVLEVGGEEYSLSSDSLSPSFSFS